MKKFSQRLKELRDYYDMTQSEVAVHVNLSAAAVGNYERGTREPGIKELILWADFFKVSDSLDQNEIDMIIHILAGGKECSWIKT